jgi:hypothetical protein
MKQITTLVEDIKEVLGGARPVPEEDVREFSASLATMLVDRLSQGSKPSGLRMSNYASPDRKLWYTVNKPEYAEPLPPEARLKFLYGDIIEYLMLFLVKQAGHEVQHEQKEVQLHGVLGHIDGVIDGVVVDVKSANARSFAKFRDHLLDFDDPFGYRDQLSLYVESSKDLPGVKVKKQGAFLAVDKELGNLALDVYTKKDTDYEKETLRKRSMLSESAPPPRCYPSVPEGKSGNHRLGVECSYCPFKARCWADSNGGKGLAKAHYARGPVWLTRIEKEPDVEITYEV